MPCTHINTPLPVRFLYVGAQNTWIGLPYAHSAFAIRLRDDETEKDSVIALATTPLTVIIATWLFLAHKLEAIPKHRDGATQPLDMIREA
jgi:hypothetical protein